MLEWKPKRLLGSGLGIGAMVAVCLLDLVLLYSLRSQTPSFVSFILGMVVALSVPLLIILGYLLYGLFSLKYLIGRDTLVISWARRQEIVPLTAIEAVVPLKKLDETIKVRGFCWPGHCIAQGRGENIGEVLCYSTVGPAEGLVITTPSVSFVISPANPTGFLAALQARRKLGPAQELKQTRSDQGLAGLAIWRDWKVLGLAALAGAANASLFGYIAFRYPDLPDLVPLLSEGGQVRLIGTKQELFELPVIGLIVFVANTILGFALHRWERPLTYFLTTVALVVQILVWSALLSAIR